MLSLPVISYCVLTITLVQCADNNGDGSATIVRSDINNDGLGPYNYFYETSNGIKQTEQSSAIATKNLEELLIEVVGSYSYPGTDGKIYEVRYVANATGFYPTGDHIKVPKVVPWPSANTLDNEQSLTNSGSNTDGIFTDNDMGKVSIINDGGGSGTILNTESEVTVQNVDAGGIDINATSTGSQSTSSVNSQVQNTYIPPPDTTYLPPHSNAPITINQLVFGQDQIEPINTNTQQVLLKANVASENQKREAKYEVLNPESNMNKFARPSNIVYFILKPQGFSMPS